MWVLIRKACYVAIDHIDYINGIGNRSLEQYVCIRDGRALRVIVEVDGFIEFYVHWYRNYSVKRATKIKLRPLHDSR